MIFDNDYITKLPNQVRLLVGIFLVVLSIGYFTGLAFVNKTTNLENQGIIENYNGNEDNEDAQVMKFKKSRHEMLNIVHTHVLSMSIIFFILGLLVYGSRINSKLKSFLLIEPLLSVIITFGGIYLIWSGIPWMSYIVIISGSLMTLSFIGSVLAIFYSLLLKQN